MLMFFASNFFVHFINHTLRWKTLYTCAFTAFNSYD